jgi:hypothetical protein
MANLYEFNTVLHEVRVGALLRGVLFLSKLLMKRMMEFRPRPQEDSYDIHNDSIQKRSLAGICSQPTNSRLPSRQSPYKWVGLGLCVPVSSASSPTSDMGGTYILSSHCSWLGVY